MKWIHLPAFMACMSALVGCASLPPGHQPDARDRFERVNRSIYAFNVTFDRAVLHPAAVGYVRITPTPVRRSVSNFLSNLAYPRTIINDALQGKFRDAGNDIARLLMNSVIGIGGLFDPASHAGLDRHVEDFGLTLGHWGVGDGPFVMLPFLGPSSVRDTVGLIPDEATYPSWYISNPYATWSLFVVNAVDIRVSLFPTDKPIASAYDPYAFVRNAYLQHRDYLVHGDSAASDAPPEDPDSLPPDSPTPASPEPAR
jgi:phospholipid-binding lipoprotein MlaA